MGYESGAYLYQFRQLEMEEIVVENRTPIKKALKQFDGLPREFLTELAVSKKFTMTRIIHSSDIGDAEKYAYLEHLLRPTIFENEFDLAVRALPKRTRRKVEEIRDTAPSPRASMMLLEERTERIDLTGMHKPDIATEVFVLSEQQVVYQKHACAGKGNLPRCFLVQTEEIVLILYPNSVAVIDGFDPVTSKECSAIITPEILSRCRQAFFSQGPVRASQEVLMRLSEAEPSPNIRLSALVEPVEVPRPNRAGCCALCYIY